MAETSVALSSVVPEGAPGLPVAKPVSRFVHLLMGMVSRFFSWVDGVKNHSKPVLVNRNMLTGMNRQADRTKQLPQKPIDHVGGPLLSEFSHVIDVEHQYEETSIAIGGLLHGHLNLANKFMA